MPRAKEPKQPRSVTADDVELGRRIRTARLQAEISQSELASKLGVSFQQVQKYEKGVNRVSAARVMIMARALGKPTSYFIEELRVKKTAKMESIDQFMSTREGTQLVEAAMTLSPAVQQNLINIVRQLNKAVA
jgi:transcriptional regulator with XRE-family HTH domain